MRILIPCHFPLEGSGSGIYVRNVAGELLNRKHEVLIVAPGHPAHADMALPMREIAFDPHSPAADVPFEFPSFTTHPLSHKTFEAMSADEVEVYANAYRTRIEQAVREFEPELIHAQHLWVAAAQAAQTGLPVVTTSHGTDIIGFKTCPRFREHAFAAARGSRAIIAVSRAVAQDVLTFIGRDVARTHVILNGVDPRQFCPRPVDLASLLQRLHVPVTGKRAVCFVGKLTWFKGCDTLIQAAKVYEAAAPDVLTLIVGDGHLRDELQARAARLGLRGVVFLGTLAHRDLPEVYNASELTCVPSRGEPFSLVALESMACGTPVVGFRSGGLPEIVSDRRGALVPEHTHEALARAILAELDARSKRSKGLGAAEFARTQHPWSRVVDRTLEVYEQALT